MPAEVMLEDERTGGSEQRITEIKPLQVCPFAMEFVHDGLIALARECLLAGFRQATGLPTGADAASGRGAPGT